MSQRNPSRTALAGVVLWLVQLALTVVVCAQYWFKDRQHPELWWHALLATSLALGVLLITQLQRALRWRPRRSPRVLPEVLAERQRIARDLHDHVGTQLLSAMALLQGERPHVLAARERMSQSLLDLRLLVDAMAADEDALPLRLARLRHRLQPAIDQQGIRVHWEVSDGLPDGFDPETTAGSPPEGPAAGEITAIAQEALSNVLQHAKASELRLSLRCVAGGSRWCLEVQDNGVGLPPTLAGAVRGQGLRNMHMRARALGGVLHWETPCAGGLLVRLEVPAHSVLHRRAQPPGAPANTR